MIWPTTLDQVINGHLDGLSPDCILCVSHPDFGLNTYTRELCEIFGTQLVVKDVRSAPPITQEWLDDHAVHIISSDYLGQIPTAHIFLDGKPTIGIVASDPGRLGAQFRFSNAKGEVVHLSKRVWLLADGGSVRGRIREVEGRTEIHF